MTNKNRILKPSPPSPAYAVDYECHDVVSKVSALAGLSEVEMNALRLAAAISEMSQADFLKDLFLAAAESHLSELGSGQIYLRDVWSGEDKG